MKDKRTGRIGKDRYPMLIEMIGKGMNALEIADALNVNQETVRKFARKRGIEVKKETLAGKCPNWTPEGYANMRKPRKILA